MKLSSHECHRKAAGTSIDIIPLKPPFSSFDYIEKEFGDNYDSIRRIFSLARSFNSTNLVSEDIPPSGIIEEENLEIKSIHSDYINTKLKRLSFWISKNPDQFKIDNPKNKLIGYAILKKDCVPELGINDWHVFESVFSKYPHPHNCVPRPQRYCLKIGCTEKRIDGLIYCQQNQINKSCAQVAIRTLISRILPDNDISYSDINKIARKIKIDKPAEGLTVPQIKQILSEFNIHYIDFDYNEGEKTEIIKKFPYQKFVYAGLEGGNGALIGFRLAGRGLKEEARHIIPIYGHTFNKDTWAPDADASYFRIGEGFGYIPSESWTSSFLGHDDNFGPNFCIPRLYIENDKVDYVVEIFRHGVRYSGVFAEAIALDVLYSLIPELSKNNIWIERLIYWTNIQGVVFRAISLKSKEYVDHLSGLVDWYGNKESAELCRFLHDELPSWIWVVEISTPQLFPANERKIGEIVLDASKALNLEDMSFYDVFVFARLPGAYYLGGDVESGNPSFNFVESAINSHTELYK